MHLDLPGGRLERSADGHAFLFEERYGFIYLLNEVGEFVTQELMNADRSEEELVGAIKQRFEVQGGSDPIEDLKQFLSKLRSYGLLT
ncbi:MAG: PqqD family protein [Gammaproteobacteria bacterium]|nr:PqqD family protein [Gammaproteobacteria bacterium]MBU1654104.1 PqqD family protein [Gammaproteobacteria bacterium]MBU1961679.1 PqqD family protein [Gammaproteobacteria bacterium]